jgi:protein-tyrosine phosphatase
MRGQPLTMAGIMGSTDDFLHRKALAFAHHDDLYRFCHALEDLPEDARAQAIDIASDPSGISFQRKVLDDLENAALGAYGNLERVPLLHFLSDYPVIPYTYGISPVMSRGERPSPQKLADLFRRGYLVTVNLCAETEGGDGPDIDKAQLAGELATFHIPIVDMDPPTPAQMIELFDVLTGPTARLTYVHCEAGKARTGVATACYRMAIMGWSAEDALTEAKNFGCVVPMQQAFIEDFGRTLRDHDQARVSGQPDPHPELGRYPLQPLGSVKASAEELTATVSTVARTEKGEIN